MARPTMVSRARLSLLAAAFTIFAAALFAAVPSAAAQQEEACRQPDIELSESPESWDPGSRFVVLVAIVNPNEPPVQSVTARVDVVPPRGWSASLARSTFTMSPQSAPVEPLTITAPQRGSGLAGGDVVVTVHFTCHREGGIDASSQASATIPVELTQARVPWLLVGVGVAAAAGAAGAVYAIRARQPKVWLKSTYAERNISAGRGAHFPIVVGNRGRQHDALTLSVDEVPDGWRAYLAAEELELEGREERNLWLRVRAPPGTPPGESRSFTVRAASRRDPRDVATVEVIARVVPRADTATKSGDPRSRGPP